MVPNPKSKKKINSPTKNKAGRASQAASGATEVPDTDSTFSTAPSPQTHIAAHRGDEPIQRLPPLCVLDRDGAEVIAEPDSGDDTACVAVGDILLGYRRKVGWGYACENRRNSRTPSASSSRLISDCPQDLERRLQKAKPRCCFFNSSTCFRLGAIRSGTQGLPPDYELRITPGGAQESK